ncbi:hypothetical protein EE612_052049 [Oryza sativa]|nr:hypothetical protein EE612_052049 [Oryza sativa]
MTDLRLLSPDLA